MLSVFSSLSAFGGGAPLTGWLSPSGGVFLILCLSLALLYGWRSRKTVADLRAELERSSSLTANLRGEQQALSERMQAKRKALEQVSGDAHRFAGLIKTSRDAIIGVDNDGVIWHWNAAAEQLFRRPSSEMVGKSLESLRTNPGENMWRELQRVVSMPFHCGQSQVAVKVTSREAVPVWLSISSLPVSSLPVSSLPVSSLPVSSLPVSSGQQDDRNETGGYAIIARDMSDKKRIEEKISQALLEKNALLQEVHHRVKNNLQLICSLLRLQSKEAQDEGALKLFRKSEARVRALALVHEKLYRSESLTSIDFGGYIQDLVSQLVRTGEGSRKGQGAKGDVQVSFDLEGVQFPIDTAITCGLIINELVTNSLKHGISSVAQPALRISLKKVAESIVVGVWDNGAATVDPEIIESSPSLGLNLVRTLTRQLGGAVTVQQGNGVEFTVTLPTALLNPKELLVQQSAA